MSNNVDDLSGYVPSEASVKAGARAAVDHSVYMTASGGLAWRCTVDSCDWTDGWSSESSTAEAREQHLITAVIAAAVPVEVARLLGEVRALADGWVRQGVLRSLSGTVAAERGHELRAVLDTAVTPVQVEGCPLAEKVRALHRPVSWTGVSGKCADEDCDHPERQVDCPEVVFEVCNHCIGIVEPFAPDVGPYPVEVMWPCPTVAALGTVGVPAQVDEAATGGQS